MCPSAQNYSKTKPAGCPPVLPCLWIMRDDAALVTALCRLTGPSRTLSLPQRFLYRSYCTQLPTPLSIVRVLCYL